MVFLFSENPSRSYIRHIELGEPNYGEVQQSKF